MDTRHQLLPKLQGLLDGSSLLTHSVLSEGAGRGKKRVALEAVFRAAVFWLRPRFVKRRPQGLQRQTNQCFGQVEEVSKVLWNDGGRGHQGATCVVGMCVRSITHVSRRERAQRVLLLSSVMALVRHKTRGRCLASVFFSFLLSPLPWRQN